jgi:heme/copper-type cytochrome/quinol oxidase subunit 3
LVLGSLPEVGIKKNKFGLVNFIVRNPSQESSRTPLLSPSPSARSSKENMSGGDYLLISISLGVYFLLLQGFEYATVPFHINDSVFGSIFFMLTGLHGLHVVIGILFLTLCYFRILLKITSWKQLALHFGAWYWHFVDVVWILLFIVIYLSPYLS